MKFISLLFIFFISTSIFAQQSDNLLAQLTAIQEITRNKKLLSKAEKLLHHFEQNHLSSLEPLSIEQQVYHTTKANFLGVKEAYKEALPHIKEALKIAHHHPDSTQQLINTHWVARSTYEQIDQYDKAIKQGKQLIDLYNKEQLIELAKNYQKIGVFYQKKTQSNKAIEYFNKALATLKKTDKATSIDFANLYRAFSMGYFRLEDYQKQLVYIKKAIAICKTDTNTDNRHLEIALLNNLGGYYIQMHKNQEGLNTYHQYVAATLKEYGPTNSLSAVAYMNLGVAYAQTNNLAASEIYFRKSIDVKISLYGQHNPSVAIAYGNLVVLLNLMGRFEDALEVSQQSFIANTNNYKDSNRYADLVPVVAKHKILDQINAIGNLSNRVKAFYELYKKNNKLSYLQHAHQTVLAQIAILDQAKNELSDQDRLKVLGKNFMPFILGVDISAQLYQLTKEKRYLEDGFQLAERSRDAILNNALSTKKALNFGGIPDSLITIENQLKQNISLIDKKLLDTKQRDSLYFQLQEEFFALKRKQEQLTQTLETNYPLYYKIKYQTNIASIQDIQQKILDQQTTLLSYYIQYPKAYLWTITNKQSDVQVIHLDSNYTADIKRYRNVLTSFKYIKKNPKKANKTFDELSYKFYTTFVQSALKKHPNNRLIIIPDHLLGHLPFETFTILESNNTVTNYHEKPYLINDHEIQYSYSGTLLLQNQQQYFSLPKQVRTIAVAADYQNNIVTQQHRTEEDLALRHILQPLPEVQNEVKALENIINGTFLYGNKATEGEFKEKVADHSIIHLAMHGIFNQKNPIASSLAFTEDGNPLEDNFLRASEISNLPLKAQLVVLSACETGYGKFERGEGIMSLARSFMHAGVPSLIVSLWQVNDYSTSSIMQLFYHELKEGKSKSAALRAAKLTYMQTHEGIAAHPALWAAFIQLGNQGALEFTSNRWSIQVILSLLVVLFLLFVLILQVRKRKKNDH